MPPQSANFWKKPGLWVALGALVLVGVGSILVADRLTEVGERLETS